MEALNTHTPTATERRAGLKILLAVAETIREAGSVPGGHLYAGLVDRMSLQGFEAMIQILVNGNLVRRDASHLLTWIGPEVK
jgi:hypothetical protein